MDAEETKVIFRILGGEVIAIFPEILGTNCYTTCCSYMHFGQHCHCEPYSFISKSRLATPQEYADLKAELENIGYNLKVIKRHRRSFSEQRAKEILDNER